ncbi:MAG: hypothetical protein ERJ67_04055 [Aphanocapsa feldmannii 277cV]|uniref:DUF4276 family protein n=1 Tax=Aphanocapsa feldmannii 277cV TaxID=2507553 RepID=A0A524RPA5_9CHRO|nr:MAG: hypothetical protein ERJ67_04055 [Aphanocapsa feldmannii 277cV]
MSTVERSTLHVEGTDDVHVIKHLLLRHGIDCPLEKDPRQGRKLAPHAPEIRSPRNGRNGILESIDTAVRFSNNRSVGFVLDADAEPQDRWHAVCGKLKKFGLDLPAQIPPGGFVHDVAEFRARVGVWLMPDNQREGALEQFLADLVKDNDALLPVAERATATAAESGAEFPAVDRQKAVLHTWLAWQKKPGLPYGTAICAEYFRDDSPSALAFVDWYKRVFQET